MLTGGSSFFLVSITGQVEEGDFPDYDSLYCRLFWVCGQDWTVTAGQEEGVSQVSRSASYLLSHLKDYHSPISFWKCGKNIQRLLKTCKFCLIKISIMQEESGCLRSAGVEFPAEHHLEVHQPPRLAPAGGGGLRPGHPR